MLRSQISKKASVLTVWTLLIFFASYTLGQSENVISVEQIRADRACGPRCLWALIQITRAGKPDCGVKCIYQLIDKEPLSPTNLKDLKDAAEQLGFSAKGYKLKVVELAKVDGYAILPVGSATGTADSTCRGMRPFSTCRLTIPDLMNCPSGLSWIRIGCTECAFAVTS